MVLQLPGTHSVDGPRTRGSALTSRASATRLGGGDLSHLCPDGDAVKAHRDLGRFAGHFCVRAAKFPSKRPPQAQAPPEALYPRRRRENLPSGGAKWTFSLPF